MMKLFDLFLVVSTLFKWFWFCRASHFMGVELFADVSSNLAQETITVHWRFMWNTYGIPPTVETISVCPTGPCPQGPSSIDTSLNNCTSTGISSADNSVMYSSWTGSSSVLYYPIGSVPASGTTNVLNFYDGSWGLLNPMGIISMYGGQLQVLTARRTDNGLFNRTPRSAVAAVVTLWPACGGTSFTIPVVDPDGDPFQCRWSSSTAECNDCCQSTYASKSGFTYPFTLSSGCTVTYTGGAVASNAYYAICIQMEDYYPSSPTVRISSSSLQFIVEVATSPCSLLVSSLITRATAKYAKTLKIYAIIYAFIISKICM